MNSTVLFNAANEKLKDNRVHNNVLLLRIPKYSLFTKVLFPLGNNLRRISFYNSH